MTPWWNRGSKKKAPERALRGLFFSLQRPAGYSEKVIRASLITILTTGRGGTSVRP